MKKLLFVLALAVSATACTDADKTRKVLRQQNYQDVEITGYSWFSCSEDDTFATGFTATAPNGEYVTGTVCSGLLKGATVRID